MQHIPVEIVCLGIILGAPEQLRWPCDVTTEPIACYSHINAEKRLKPRSSQAISIASGLSLER
jgi:hypothetical protein